MTVHPSSGQLDIHLIQDFEASHDVANGTYTAIPEGTVERVIEPILLMNFLKIFILPPLKKKRYLYYQT